MMTRTSAFEGGIVTLEQILKAKDNRYSLQRRMVQEYRMPLISFSVVMAGAVKQNPISKLLFEEGCRLISSMLSENNIASAKQTLLRSEAGDTAIIACRSDTIRLKKLCCALESSESWGRLLDIDVIGLDGKPVARANLGDEGRGCIVCGLPGSGCARSRAHSTQQILDAIWERAQTLIKTAGDDG